VAITKEVAGGVTIIFNRLHALDVTTGAEKFAGPVVIQGVCPRGLIGNDGHGNVAIRSVETSSALLASVPKRNGVRSVHAGISIIRPITAGSLLQRLHPRAECEIWNMSQRLGSGFGNPAVAPRPTAAGNLYLESGNGNWDARTPITAIAS